MYIYAIISQKGGVGKTTTAVNLGAGLAREGKRVLLIDLDPQSSLTVAVGRKTAEVSIGEVLLHPDRILSAIYPCAGEMHVITASATLSCVFIDLSDAQDPARRLARALDSVSGCYDYVMIDCPPSLSHATSNSLTAAHVCVVPLQCEFLSLRGLADVQEIAAAIQETTNPNLRLRVVGTMFDRRTLHAADVLAEARNALPGLVYQTVIPRTVRLAEAPAAGQTIFEYAPDSNGAFAYAALAQEILTEDSGYGTTERRTGSYPIPSYAQPAA